MRTFSEFFPAKDNKPGTLLFSPFTDFLLLGGLFAVLLPFLLRLDMSHQTDVVAVVFFISFLINFPHFAASYLLLYKDIKRKLFSQTIPRAQVARYWLAAIVSPLVLIALFSYAFFSQNPILIGNLILLMFCLVGWHYVKQGFGMLITLSVKQKCFFTPREKKLLVLNTHLCWLFAAVALNLHGNTHQYFNFAYTSLVLPETLFAIVTTLLLVSTLLVCYMLINRYSHKKTMPSMSALSIYFITCYLWIVAVTAGLFNPAIYLLIPAFHSLQYLTIVAHVKKNEQEAVATKAEQPHVRKFMLASILLGALGFEMIPRALDFIISYNTTIFSSALFLTFFYLFINIHHYFIDHAIWRKEDEYVRQYLFPSKGA